MLPAVVSTTTAAARDLNRCVNDWRIGLFLATQYLRALSLPASPFLNLRDRVLLLIRGNRRTVVNPLYRIPQSIKPRMLGFRRSLLVLAVFLNPIFLASYCSGGDTLQVTWISLAGGDLFSSGSHFIGQWTANDWIISSTLKLCNVIDTVERDIFRGSPQDHDDCGAPVKLISSPEYNNVLYFSP
ncbi:hypothetical protein BDY19DRAFT_253531 [Irpex rosettiformis]|uniref:Uncharacterized protein n=1 Tax=Irpex rosettiformis TaxID=378272 RepID=A0ACB8U036_9APHY|nr:hypothetical protein BDY19DRAFT_253531 [Irpex rosettiformis]